LQNRNIEDAFRERPGLYYLLRDADNNNTIDPLVVDFDTLLDNVQYPLRNPIKSTVAKVSCENDKLRFHLGSTGGASYGLTLNQYLIHLEDAARQEWNAYRWRDKTVRLHHYRLIYRTGVSFYEDFGNESILPDYISGFGSAEVKAPFGGTGTILIDRYGNRYLVVSGSFGAGGKFAGGHVEGYAVAHNTFKTKLSIPSESTINNSITGWGMSVGGGIGWGFGESAPFSFNYDTTSFVEYSVGVNVSVGISVGYGMSLPKDETRAWHWLDRIQTGARHYNDNYLPPETAGQYDLYPGNDCNCGSP
jgi:hypothetical protein